MAGRPRRQRSFVAATSDFTSASSKLGSWWTSVARLVPVLAQQRQALATGVVTPETSWPSPYARHRASTIRASSTTRGRSTCERISAMLGPAKTLDESLSTARDRLAGLRSPWLIGPIQSRLRIFDADLRRAKSSTDLAVKAIPLVPDMLGAEAAPALLPGLRVAGGESGARWDRRCLRRAHGRGWSHQSHRLRPCRIARQRSSCQRRQR